MLKIRKKMLIVSQFQKSSDGYCYAQFLKKLAEMNHFDVAVVDCKRNYFPFGSKSSDGLFWPLKSICNFFSNLVMIYKFIRNRPDILFLVKGENISFRVLKLLKKIWRFKLVNFYPDSPFCCWNSNSSYNVMRSLPLYDRFAIWSRLLAKVLVMSGTKQVFYWPFVCDKELFKPAVVDKEFGDDHFDETYKSDVCFVGTWDRKREKYLTELAFRVWEIDLKIWGDGWKENLAKDSTLLKYVQGGALKPQEISKALSLAKIVINFLRDQNFTSHNMRTFEAASCGAFLLTERSEEQSKELFVEDESIACFSGMDEMCRKVEFYLKKKDERARIAKAALSRSQEFSNAEQLFKELMHF